MSSKLLKIQLIRRSATLITKVVRGFLVRQKIQKDLAEHNPYLHQLLSDESFDRHLDRCLKDKISIKSLTHLSLQNMVLNENIYFHLSNFKKIGETSSKISNDLLRLRKGYDQVTYAIQGKYYDSLQDKYRESNYYRLIINDSLSQVYTNLVDELKSCPDLEERVFLPILDPIMSLIEKSICHIIDDPIILVDFKKKTQLDYSQRPESERTILYETFNNSPYIPEIKRFQEKQKQKHLT